MNYAVKVCDQQYIIQLIHTGFKLQKRIKKVLGLVLKISMETRIANIQIQ
jgi:hypothetical protein